MWHWREYSRGSERGFSKRQIYSTSPKTFWPQLASVKFNFVWSILHDWDSYSQMKRKGWEEGLAQWLCSHKQCPLTFLGVLVNEFSVENPKYSPILMERDTSCNGLNIVVLNTFKICFHDSIVPTIIRDMTYSNSLFPEYEQLIINWLEHPNHCVHIDMVCAENTRRPKANGVY